jgi:DNA-binding response OmpR family regulator
MKLLVIDADLQAQATLVRSLQREGFLCETAATWSDGMYKIAGYEYDCILLDDSLPDGDGLELVRFLRANKSAAGLIVLSSVAKLETRVLCLEQGADDCLDKPYSIAELLARMRAVMRRRSAAESEARLECGPISLLLDAREAQVNGVPLPLTKKEFGILLYLVRNKNRVVSKERMVEYLWPDHMADATCFDFLYAHVKNLRKKLAERQCGHHLLTVYGIGYKLYI